MKIMAIYGSSRENGNSQQLTEKVLKDLPATHIHLRHKHILPIVDQRHEEGGFTFVDDEHDDIILQMLEHDVLIFATPLYWYGMSGLMKNFIDRWSQSLRSNRYDFKGKMKDKQVYVVITGGDEVKIQGLPLVQQFKYICDFMGMNMAGYILGRSGKPGDVLRDANAVQEAHFLNLFLRSQVD